MQKTGNDRLLIPGAFAVIYIVWGSTYLVNYFAIQIIPPFLMSGSRFFVAGGILYFVGWLLGKGVPSWKQWKNTALMGFIFLAIGAGGVVWAEQYVDTGIASLIVAFEPLLVVIMLWGMRGQRPGIGGIIGVMLGITGMFLLVEQAEFISNPKFIWGMIAIIISITSWAFGAIFIKGLELPKSKMMSAAMQMIGGGAALLIFSLITGEYLAFDPSLMTLKVILSWSYLVAFGSILAYSSFNYLLMKVSPDQVATSTYVNPVVALFLGWGFNQEHLSTQSLIAATILLTGVFFIISKFKKV